MTNWQTKKLGELLTIRHGRNQREVESADGEYPILGTGGEMGRATKYLYDKPSVLIGRKGTIDKPRYMDTPFWTVDTLFYSEIKSENVPKFLYYVFNTIDWKRYNEASGVPSLSASTISTIKVNIPEKREQQRIVGVLEVWDEYIEKLEQKIALKEQLKKGLMQQLLTGKRRLPGFEGDWQKLKLSDIAKIRKGTQLNRSTLSENMAGLNKYAVINGGITPSGYTDTMNTKAGAITISEGGNSCGYVNYIKEDFWLGGHCYEIINNQKVDQIYLYPFLKANQSKIMSLRVGSGLPNIQKSSLENLKVLLPETKKEQEELGLIMLHSVIEIEQLSEKLQIMKLQKKYLLKKLITGTIRTPEDLQPLDTSRLERSAL